MPSEDGQRLDYQCPPEAELPISPRDPCKFVLKWGVIELAELDT